MAFPAAPFIPFACDTGLVDLDPLDDESGAQALQFQYLTPEMTQLHFDYEAYRAATGVDAMSWTPTSPEDTLSSRSEVAKSPGKQSHQASLASRGSASLSPQGDALIYTPASTMLEYTDDAGLAEDFDADNLSTSPASNISHPDDFVMVPVPRRNVGEAGGGNRSINPRPPPGSGVLPLPTAQMSHLSQESSSSSSSASHPAMPPQRLQHWQSSFASSTSAGMDDNTYIPYSAADESIYPTDSFTDDGSALHLAGYDTSLLDNHALGNMPFRSFPPNAAAYPASFNSVPSLHQQSAHFYPPGHINTNTGFITHGFSAAGNFTATPQYPQDFAYPRAPYIQQAPPAQPLNILPSNAQLPTQQQASTQAPPQRPSNVGRGGLPNTDGAARRKINQQKRKTAANANPPSKKDKTTAGSSRRLIKAEPGSTPPSSIHAPQTERVRKGGRTRGTTLNDASRLKSHSMRKVGACWRCALQRDPCDEGNPCQRCLMRSQKGQTYFFECDRSKLPDLVHDFLPPSMTLMHSKQTIEDTVKQEVLRWDKDNGLDIYLSSGYGPPLRWRVHEFTPRTNELLFQLQFLQDRDTGLSTCNRKYAPPFGLLKLDTSDDLHFDAYLDRLLEPEQLLDFGWSCYEEESIFDEEEFQAKLLDLMCKLYIATQDQNLKNVLRDVLKMIIVTFIMGHTLTIVEDTLPTVLESVRHSARPAQLAKHTSPRLANRQLKFFFAIIRANVYERILRWQQQILHTAGKKDVTWLQTFCATLGFAMVLEELQRTLQIQAEASMKKGELSEEMAQAQAFNACDRIDTRFRLLVGLFQCKYRDRTWSHGSFGPGTPELKEDCAVDFLSKLRTLVEERQDHLRSRENVPFGKETQSLYTTRLTARFLLPFLNLPAS